MEKVRLVSNHAAMVAQLEEHIRNETEKRQSAEMELKKLAKGTG